ncbi:hypothetical protein [Aquimarina sp. RZ0]|uniref:hypothetical protein n=1 Tax=Aquimarina sp. RZ0 TaxID=2607730 RepID=UPI0011F30BE8|nr:hypothetical protein [Aquimarina sp. RZ0]KAA1247490.1 hypothetical protein F0000_03250 [Aquimarina sp. RZ0]
MKIFNFKNGLFLFFITSLFISCSNEELENEETLFNDESELIFHYQGKSFEGEEKFEQAYSNVLENSHWVMDDDTNVYLFDTMEESDLFSAQQMQKAVRGIQFIFNNNTNGGRSLKSRVFTSRDRFQNRARTINFRGGLGRFWNNNISAVRFAGSDVRILDSVNLYDRARFQNVLGTILSFGNRRTIAFTGANSRFNNRVSSIQLVLTSR